MNPKDMTGRALLRASMDSYSSKKQHAGISLLDWLKDNEAMESELLRRLDEADALRKENEELRRDAERYRFIRDNADTIAINSSLQYCDIFRSEGIEEELDIAMKFESDYATSEKTKESEASHES